MKLIKSSAWGKILLPASLLIILIQGLVSLPEVRVNLFPEKVWRDRFYLVVKGSAQVRESIIALEAELAPLNNPSEPGVTKHSHLKSEAAAQNSFERQHYQARKKFVDAERKLWYLKLMLDNLPSTTSQRLDDDPNFGNHDQVLIQKQISTLRQQCQQYGDILNIQAQRLQKLREYSDNQIDHSGKGISTKN